MRIITMPSVSHYLYLVAIPLTRSAIYFNDWLFFRRVKKARSAYLEGALKDNPEELKENSEKEAAWLVANSIELRRKIEKAGLEVPTKSFMQAKGYGYVSQATIDAVQNILLLNRDVQSDLTHAIDVAQGHMLYQSKNSLNPLFWLEFLFFLPRELVSESGIELTSNLSRLALNITQLIYWGTAFVALVLHPELLEAILHNGKKG